MVRREFEFDAWRPGLNKIGRVTIALRGGDKDNVLNHGVARPVRLKNTKHHSLRIRALVREPVCIRGWNRGERSRNSHYGLCGAATVLE